MTTIILVRHGYSEANHDGTFTGQRDVDLNELGYKQAEIVADYIASNYKVDKIYSSDLKRAYKTAKPLADKLGLDIITTSAFREINGGEFEGLTYPKLLTYEKYMVFRNDPANCQFPGGESMREVCSRAMSKLSEIVEADEGKTVVIVSHANPLRAIRTMCEFGNLDEMKNNKGVPNSSVTVIEAENGEFTIKLDGYDEYLGALHTDFSSKRV